MNIWRQQTDKKTNTKQTDRNTITYSVGDNKQLCWYHMSAG